MDFSKHLFRCSSLGHLLAESKEKTNLEKYNEAVAKSEALKAELAAMPDFNKDGKTPSKLKQNKNVAHIDALKTVQNLLPIKDKIELSEGAKTHLMDVYIYLTTGRKGDIDNRYIRKGNAVEEHGITLYSRVKKEFFKKNELHLKNGFIMGTPDIFRGESITSATWIPDIKASWDLRTFYRTFTKKVSNLYLWQIRGYMWLTGAKQGSIAYCLVDTPEGLIQAEIDRLWYKMGKPLIDSKVFIAASKEIREEMTYSDIPLKKRLLEYEADWLPEYADKIEKYVIAGREYLAQIHADLQAKQQWTD